MGLTDQIRKAALGTEENFPWRDRFPRVVERVVIYVWCHRVFTIGEVAGIALVAFGLGRAWL